MPAASSTPRESVAPPTVGPPPATADGRTAGLLTRARAWLGALTPDELWLTLVAVAAFALSFERLWEFALKIDTPQWLAWLFPLIIDGITLYASYDAGRALRERRLLRLMWDWLLMLGFTAVSFWFQYLAAPEDAWTWRVARAFLPVALLTAIEIRNSARAARGTGAPTFWQLLKLRALERTANGTPTWKQIREYDHAVRDQHHAIRMAAIQRGELPSGAELAAVTTAIRQGTVRTVVAARDPSPLELETAATPPATGTDSRRHPDPTVDRLTGAGGPASPSPPRPTTRHLTTARQREEIQRLWHEEPGITNKQLAERLGLRERTVERRIQELGEQGVRRLRVAGGEG